MKVSFEIVKEFNQNCDSVVERESNSIKITEKYTNSTMIVEIIGNVENINDSKIMEMFDFVSDSVLNNSLFYKI